jgi:hypothetical protein
MYNFPSFIPTMKVYVGNGGKNLSTNTNIKQKTVVSVFSWKEPLVFTG